MKRMLCLSIAISLLAGPTAFGAVSDEDFEQLRQQLAAVSQRLDELAEENAELRRSQAQTATVMADVQSSVTDGQKLDSSVSSKSWADRIRLDGDFRYRYETIDEQGSSTRRRNRISARSNIRADLADNIEVGFGLATGGDDPVSTNQTLGEGGSSKNVALNLAYADWRATEGLHIIAGKFKNPLERIGEQPLMWDRDWTPEGLAFTYQRDWFFANALGTYLESDSSRSNDNFSWGGQIGAKGDLTETRLRGGLAYYSIKAKGKSTTFGDPSDPDDFFGNTAVEPGGLACGTTPGVDCVYLYDYILTEVFAEAAFDLGDWPTVVFADYVHNSDPSENNTGWTLGTRVGQAKERGDMEFLYYYADKEADALLGLLTDSDFAGGGTDNNGHLLKFTYGVNKTWALSAQYFINETDVASGNKADYNRLMLDTKWKWK